ncbi:MAG: enoyl-CoA hydratase/isomerase family protein [Acidimicrobiia bacterium]|nr:enoyl-CoA hydratase/isomerase family protein [Acidimicrobiia bacterium]
MPLIIVRSMETLVVERNEGVVTVTMNRPQKKNAVTGAMTDELTATFRDVARSGEDRVLVLTGAGGDFSSGADLTDSAGELTGSGLTYMRRISDLALALHSVPQPTIAKVPGVAAGMSANLAFGCDLVVAAEEARFSEIFARRGLSLDCGGSWVLPRRVGLHKAFELAYFADVISAAEAMEFGLVNRVVPAAALDKAVDEWASRLAAGPPLALSMIKAQLHVGAESSLAQALEYEAACQTVNFNSADTAEAMAAYVQKREPTFEGR